MRRQAPMSVEPESKLLLPTRPLNGRWEQLGDAETIAELLMFLPCETLGENVRNLVARWYILRRDRPVFELLADEMVSHVDVLHPAV